MKKITLILLFVLYCFSAYTQKSNNDVRKANKLYNKQEYNKAEVEYKRSLEKEKESFEANFNLANTLFRQERYNEAIEHYMKSFQQSTDEEKLKQAAILHNIANSLLAENKIDESIETYKNALRRNPNDDDTRYNLAFAQYLRKKMQQENENKQDKEKQDKEDQNEQNKNNQNKDEQDKENKNEQDKDKQNNAEKEKKNTAPPPSISKENAEQILRSLLENEKETQAKINRQTLKEENTIEKNW